MAQTLDYAAEAGPQHLTVQDAIDGTWEPVEEDAEAGLAEQQDAALPEMPEADFKKHFSAWEKAIEAGKKTPAQIIATLSTKYMLSNEQHAAISELDASAD